MIITPTLFKIWLLIEVGDLDLFLVEVLGVVQKDVDFGLRVVDAFYRLEELLQKRGRLLDEESHKNLISDIQIYFEVLFFVAIYTVESFLVLVFHSLQLRY